MLSDVTTVPDAPAWMPARRRVYDYVREGILSSHFPGGSFLEEEQVSAVVGVSRTPVREAFQQLHSERLIDLMPRRGAMVRLVTAQELVEVYEARLMIESCAARALCGAGQPPPEPMVAALQSMRAVPAHDVIRHVQLNTAFHTALVAGAKNGVISELYAALAARQERVAVTTIGIAPSREALIHQEHEQLVAALAAADAGRAVGILETHLQPIREIITRLPSGAA